MDPGGPTNNGSELPLASPEGLACVEVPALPLQLLLGQRRDWRGLPVVVIAEDRPQGEITWLNAQARAFGILPGQAYSTALGLCKDVRASVVPPAALGAGVARVLARLRAFTPNIEPSEDEPGIFWLDASGLEGLWGTRQRWAAAIVQAIADQGLIAMMSVGFSRFGSYAAVKSMTVDYERGIVDGKNVTTHLRVFARPEDERALADRVPLSYLAIPHKVRERLDRLAVRTLGELVKLPAAGILKRYGEETHRLHQMARGVLFMPLVPMPELQPAHARELLDFLEHDAHRLLFRAKALLDSLLPLVAARAKVIAELVLILGSEAPHNREHTQYVSHRFRPAAPTLDAVLLMDLVRLRLESVDLRMGIVELGIELVEIEATADQIALFRLGPRQDTAAASRALMRVKAELGDGAVGRFVLREAHLPRAQQGFESFQGELDPPKARVVQTLVRVRRILAHVQPMPAKPRDFRNDGWPSRDPDRGPIVRLHGPFVISGGWWLRPGSEVCREYLYAETTRGDYLWIYYDRRRRRWLEEGRIE